MPLRTAVLHGAGYAGGELVALLLGHPAVEVAAVTSRSQAGGAVWTTHPRLRGQTDLLYSAPDDLDASALDAAFVCAEHGQGAQTVQALRASGFDGLVVDLSADHRLGDPDTYRAVYGLDHPDPDAMREAVYGLAEVNGDRVAGARLVANPGCFATGITLALWPLVACGAFEAHVTALTGASGSGARPSETTHFPRRDGNVRAYKVLAHRHLAEVNETLAAAAGGAGWSGKPPRPDLPPRSIRRPPLAPPRERDLRPVQAHSPARGEGGFDSAAPPDGGDEGGVAMSSSTTSPLPGGEGQGERAARDVVAGSGGAVVHFVPASGPWTRGIWGTAHVAFATPPPDGAIAEAFEAAYGERPLVRLSPGELPELLPTVGTPFCDVGWVERGGHLVVGFALDNLLKGAASQAVQNLNLALGLPEALGLLPGGAVAA